MLRERIFLMFRQPPIPGVTDAMNVILSYKCVLATIMTCDIDLLNKNPMNMNLP